MGISMACRNLVLILGGVARSSLEIRRWSFPCSGLTMENL